MTAPSSTSTVSLDTLGDIAAPEAAIPTTRIRLPWRTMDQRLADPSWVPSFDRLPVWSSDPSVIAQAITEHSGSDQLTTSQLNDLVGRVCRRNAIAATELVERMRETNLEQLVDAWTNVLEAWDALATTTAADLERGPVSVAIASYLTVALQAGLTPAQAARFAHCPDARLEAAVAQPNPVALAHLALRANPTASYADVAETIDVSAAYLRMIVSRHGDPCREQRMTDDRPERIRELASQGLSYRKIAAEASCSIGFVSKVLKAAS